MKILVLGHNGMLGHMVCDYFSKEKDHNIETLELRWPTQSFKDCVKNYTGDVIINCIGSIPQRKDTFTINYELPIWLENNSKCKIIHPGTDCEEDRGVYGTSKRKASDYILEYGKNTKIIKTSIIGPEKGSNNSLLEWFLSNDKSEISGYSRCYWNGITTLQWSKICHDILLSWDKYDTRVIPFTECISKFDLLNTLKEVYEKDIAIRNDPRIEADKCLVGNIETPTIREQLISLRNYTT